MIRPKKSIRVRAVAIRMTDEDHAVFTQAAAAASVKVSEYLRRAGRAIAASDGFGVAEWAPRAKRRATS